MVSIETIREQFDELGIEPSDEVVNACITICLNNGINDPVEFVEQWMAYSVSKLGGAEPTVAYLNDMEAHEYTGKARKLGKAATIVGGTASSNATPRIDPKVSKLTTYRNVDSAEQDVLEMYGCVTPKASKAVSRLQHTKNTPDRVRGSPFATVTYSPISTSKHEKDSEDAKSSKSGQIVYTYGKAQLLKQINWLPAASSGGEATNDGSTDIPTKSKNGGREAGGRGATKDTAGPPGVKGISIGYQAGQFANENSKYMFDSSYDRVMILSDRIYETGSAICYRLAQEELCPATQQATLDEGSSEVHTLPNSANHAMDEDDRTSDREMVNWLDGVKVHHVDYPSSDTIRVLGRIVVEPKTSSADSTGVSSTAAAAGRSNDQQQHRLSIVDFDEHTLRNTKLDLSHVKVPWSLFPGQTVLLEGINPRGTMFTVQRVHHMRKLNLPCAPSTLDRPLKMVIASAPFTDRTDLLYEKLTGLLDYCSTDPPDVLLLTGPLADANRPVYKEVAETFDEYYEKIVGTIMSAVGSRTEVFIVANHDDVNSSFVYPTPPYRVASFYKNLHLLPDPCLFSIEGLEIGVTTVDSIGHLIENECCSVDAGDKIKRALNYLFHQASFYPLNPPMEDIPLDVDMLNDFGRLTRVPNVMVCPSALNRFIREINGCVCINPGFVEGHQTPDGGSYARLIIHPPVADAPDAPVAASSSTASPATQQRPPPPPSSYIACQIIKS
ncbi:DNA polymerase alpha subunit B [Anopheles bellator]|uniref:DNA polymerase alpha subunit B n=1 Tax=Anopheles bellator TaxID=139047 RepID=UPI0026481F0C|nr:DNA polymerase alpha subunit B [Anopheles bellator]